MPPVGPGADGKPGMKPQLDRSSKGNTRQKVIFACIHNVGRSQMAAACFNQLADPHFAPGVSTTRKQHSLYPSCPTTPGRFTAISPTSSPNSVFAHANHARVNFFASSLL